MERRDGTVERPRKRRIRVVGGETVTGLLIGNLKIYHRDGPEAAVELVKRAEQLRLERWQDGRKNFARPYKPTRRARQAQRLY